MNAKAILTQEIAVHELVYEIYLDRVVRLYNGIHAVPLAPLGVAAEAEYAARYVSEIGGNVEQDKFRNLVQSREEAHCALAIVVARSIVTDPTTLENSTVGERKRARKVLAWMTGNDPVPFALITRCKGTHSFRILLDPPVQRTLLGPGPNGLGLKQDVPKVFARSEVDAYLDHALSLYAESLREENAEFKIARLFNCLECLAHEYKDELPSRKAIRKMMDLPDGMSAQYVNSEGERIEYDPIEIAGRIRNKWFHGARLESKHLKPPGILNWIRDHPENFVGHLKVMCEYQIQRYAARVEDAS